MANKNGFDRAGFNRALARATLEFLGRSERAVAEANRLLADRARAECPVDTGRLRSSIKVGPMRRGLLGVSQEVTVGTPGPQGVANYVHDGTSRQRANPFFGRAIASTDAARTSAITRIVRAVAAGLGK